MHSPIKLFSYTFINSFIFYQFMYSQHHIWSLIRFSFSFIHSLFHQFNHPFTVEAAIALNVWVGGCKIKNQGYFWHTHPPPFGQHPRRGRWPIERRIFSIFFVFLHPPWRFKAPNSWLLRPSQLAWRPSRLNLKPSQLVWRLSQLFMRPCQLVLRSSHLWRLIWGPHSLRGSCPLTAN